MNRIWFKVCFAKTAAIECLVSWVKLKIGSESLVRSLGHPSSSAVFLVAIAKCRRSGNVWPGVAMSGKLRASDLAPITATAQTPDGCPWSCLFSTASKVISVRPLPFFTASISPLGPDWEVCQGPWEAQLPPSCQCQHPVFYCMAFRQYKVWIRLSELFRDSCSGSKLTRDILDFPLFGWPLHKILKGKYLKWVGNTVSPSLDSR